jgi:drebrin-like protein
LLPFWTAHLSLCRVLFGYEKQTTKVKVFKTGSGGFTEMVDEMSEAKALFAFVRFTIRGVNKFLYMSWCGEGVPGVVKGRFGGHIRDMERFLTIIAISSTTILNII